MNRTSELFDDRIATWLEDDPMHAPAQLLETVLAAVPSVPQRRAGVRFGAVAFRPELRFAPLAAAVAVVALLLLALAVSVLGPPRPTPLPVETPVSLVRFQSPLYGYSISHPAGWSETAADERIVGINPPFAETGVADEFRGRAGGPYPNAIVLAAAADVPEGMTLADWTAQTAVAACGTPTEPQETITVAGAPAIVSTFARCRSYFHIWVTFLRGTQGFHVVWLNFSGTEAADRQLVDRMLATFTFPGPAGTPSAAATTGAATPAPSPAGEPVPNELVGAWYHASPAWWWFLRAGDAECVQAVRTQGDCVVWRGAPSNGIGGAWMLGGNLQVAWRSGFCTSRTSTYSVALQGDSLNLVDIGGGCEGGTFALTRSGTGTAPTAPPPPTP